MENIITGKLIYIGEVTGGVSASGKDWQKQTIVIETTEQYSKTIAVILWNALVDKAIGLNQDDMLSINIEIESREFNGKWYTDVKARNIEILTDDTTSNPQQSPSEDITAGEGDVTILN